MDFVEVDSTFAEANGLDGREIVGTGALVVECHVAIALEVGNAVASAARVDRQLLVVHSDSVAVSVWVGEEAALENRVCRWLNAGWHVSWVERNLLNLGKVVLCVLVQRELANLSERELLVRPDVCQIKDVDLLLLPELLGLLGGHCLELD